jgi:uncharacterized membrane protein YdbT with pleckstrin-like domain
MAFSDRLLSADERVLRHMRTHMKALVGPILVLILLIAGLWAGLRYMPESWKPVGQILLGIVFLVVFVLAVFVPWLRWMTATYTITNRRIITRSGILNKEGHDLPLSRISSVMYERQLLDRILGCGTLILETSAEAPLRLPDVPHVEAINIELTNLLFQEHNPEEDAGRPAW